MAEEYKMLFETNETPFVVIPYDENGFDSNGIHRDTGTAYDSNGYDKDGYDVNGFNSSGIHRDTGTAYNPSGYDVNGNPEITCVYTGNSHNGGSFTGSFVYKTDSDYHEYMWDSVYLGGGFGVSSLSHGGYVYTVGAHAGGSQAFIYQICRQ